MVDEGLTDEQAEELAEKIEAGRDGIEIPEKLVEDAKERPTPAVRESLQNTIQNMPAGERLKLAMKGSREARVILLRDSSVMIRRFVLMNPRISDDEVLSVVRNRQVDGELLKIIWRRDEWLANYQIKLALVKNPKTPVQISMKYISSLLMRDLRQMAKSKNIPTAVNGMAKRIVVRGSLR